MAGQGSARVTLREIDLSQVKNPQQQPQGVPAAVVGPARKGPAFVPRTFANMQQFNEVFGNMLEIGREGNSNQFGPLALNEWMKSSQAGTYIRVLGVGDGLPTIGGKATDAGFVVGKKQLQLQSGGLAKVGDNKDAAITAGNSTAALALGRTHMLGCFMKDETGSTYLKDAGMATEDAAGTLEINFGDQVPEDLSTIELIANNGDGSFTAVIYGFYGGGNAQAVADSEDDFVALIGDASRVFDTAGGANSIAALLALEIQDNHANLNADATVDNANSTGKLSITQVNAGLAGNTLVSATITHASKNEITITGDVTINNSTKDETFQFREGTNGTAAKVVIEASGTTSLLANATVEIPQLEVDGTSTNKTYTFKALANVQGEVDADADIVEAKGFYWTASDTASIVLDTDGDDATLNYNTLKNLVSAINATTGTSGAGSTTIVATLDDATKTITVTQPFKEATVAHTVNLVDSFTATSVKFNEGDDNAGGAANIAFSGGVDGDNANATLTFRDQPNIGDSIEIPAAFGGGAGEVFKFIEEPAGNDAGNSNGAAHTDGTSVNVEIGASLDITLDNLREAILHNVPVSTFKDHVLVTISAANNTVTVKSKTAGLTQNLSLVFNMSSDVTASNPAGGSLIGNFGEKTTKFDGGQTNAAHPVIRGVLMTPQGVRAALNPVAALDDFTDVADTTVAGATVNPRKASHGLAFGETGATDDKLVGYVVGEVDSTQAFSLILNGYSNEENPAVLRCSFDPSSPAYFAKVLNTDPTKIEELGHYLYANWDIESNVAQPSSSGLLKRGVSNSSYTDMKGFLVAGAAGRNVSDVDKPDYEDFSSRYTAAKTPWIVSQFYSAGLNTAARPATAILGDARKLFRLHALDDGEVSNRQFRLLISNLRYAGENEYGSFDMTLEKFDSDPINGTPIVTWKNASLDLNSKNFIGRLVGDKHIYYDFESEINRQRLTEVGQYEIKNNFVRIELSNELKQGNIDTDALPAGFQGHSHLFTKSNGNFVELDVINANKVFSDASDTPTETLSQAQIAPLDFVTSINRKLTSTTLESDDDLSWGVKFAKREDVHTSSRELVEQVFNESILSWAKFFPSFGENPAWETDGDKADLNQNSLFSLEKISIPSGSLSADGAINSWDGAIYKRVATDTPAAGGRFVKISDDAKGKNTKYLKFRCMFQGGFDGVNIFDEEKSALTGVASLREGEDETGTQKFTGPTIMSYQRAIDVLSDKSATEFQILAIPGQRTPQVTDYAINACETRFDSLLIMDVVEKDSKNLLVETSSTKPHVRNTITRFADRVLDTSFAAAYFPDVVIRRPSDNAPIVVPPTVGMLGVMSRNDSIADPWFAPAGLNRGRLSAIDSRVQMNRALLDELYDADINPIYVPAGRSGEVYAFGQKTLLQDQSALDRINVRRLLIDIRRKVKKVGEKLLFEPNRASTLARFSALVEPIMANVQQRRGVTRYKVQIDSSTTTQNDVENNTIRGKIYLQPTKSVEFISLDFVVANTI